MGRRSAPSRPSLLADALDLLALQRGDGAPGNGDEAILHGGMAHFDESLLAPVERGVHLLAEAGIGDGQMVLYDQLPVELSRAVASHLAVEVEGGQGADGEVLGPGRGVIGHAPFEDVLRDFPVVGVDPLDMARAAQPSSRRTWERIKAYGSP